MGAIGTIGALGSIPLAYQNIRDAYQPAPRPGLPQGPYDYVPQNPNIFGGVKFGSQ